MSLVSTIYWRTLLYFNFFYQTERIESNNKVAKEPNVQSYPFMKGTEPAALSSAAKAADFFNVSSTSSDESSDKKTSRERKKSKKRYRSRSRSPSKSKKHKKEKKKSKSRDRSKEKSKKRHR